MRAALLCALPLLLATAPPPLIIDDPLDGSVFPPDFAPPTFLWRDGQATRWQFEFRFASGAALRLDAAGDLLRPGPIDPRTVAESNRPPTVPPDTHSWKPAPADWTEIKRRGIEQPVTVAITGYRGDQPISEASIRISTSRDPVGAPIFYRDVPLMPTEVEKGVIKPIIPHAVPLIEWRLRNVADDESRVLMSGLVTCANCHSFSRDGKTLAMDVDGPQNDKGMYAIASIAPRMAIRDQDVFTWNDFTGKPPGHRTIGFMAQLSPDARFAVTTLNEDMFVANFKDYRFLQVFYPTRGILAWHDRSTSRIRSLPGADNPNFVQTDGVWSPDGKYLVFARAVAKDAYPEGRRMPLSAGDPLEPPIQYGLYRIPFNGGKGGRAQAIAGASHNGMSNSFPKVSPDGRWIVWVQSKNGQLMRPDGKLWIVAAAGGVPRLMRCNTPLMNSWHSFSPNSRWMVFSSKSRSPYTQMFLTHIDENGNDTPAILIENSTASNRAVNLPEFVNIPPGGLEHIDVPVAEFYRLSDLAWNLTEQDRLDESIAQWKKALEIQPENATARNNLGVAELRAGRPAEALIHFRAILAANRAYPEVHFNAGRALAAQGNSAAALAAYRRALELNPNYAEAWNDIGVELLRQGKTADAISAWRKALAINPAFTPARHNLQRGRSPETIR